MIVSDLFPTNMSSSSNAVQNNSRLFPPFARKLAQNDYTVYATFADKLAVWLGSERAYYPAARPEVSACHNLAHNLAIYPLIHNRS